MGPNSDQVLREKGPKRDQFFFDKKGTSSELKPQFRVFGGYVSAYCIQEVYTVQNIYTFINTWDNIAISFFA